MEDRSKHEHLYPRGEWMSEAGWLQHGRPKKAIEPQADMQTFLSILVGIVIGMALASMLLCLLGRASCSLGLPFWWK